MIIDSGEIKYVSHKYSRIVSLVPSLTELLSDLGLNTEVIGITKFCVHPKAWFKSKPRVGGTKTANIEMIRQLSPDLIIANKEENLKEQVAELSRSYDVLLTSIDNLDTAKDSILQIGNLTNKFEEAKKLVMDISTKFYDLNAGVKNQHTLRAAYFIWKAPYMVAGGDTFINDMMHYCGLRNIFFDVNRYPEINLDEIKERACEIILLASEPYPFKEKHALEIKSVLPAVKIVLADGEMFSWYGSRLLKAANYFEIFRANILNENNT